MSESPLRKRRMRESSLTPRKRILGDLPDASDSACAANAASMRISRPNTVQQKRQMHTAHLRTDPPDQTRPAHANTEQDAIDHHQAETTTPTATPLCTHRPETWSGHGTKDVTERATSTFNFEKSTRRRFTLGESALRAMGDKLSPTRAPWPRRRGDSLVPDGWPASLLRPPSPAARRSLAGRARPADRAVRRPSRPHTSLRAAFCACGPRATRADATLARNTRTCQRRPLLACAPQARRRRSHRNSQLARARAAGHAPRAQRPRRPRALSTAARMAWLPSRGGEQQGRDERGGHGPRPGRGVRARGARRGPLLDAAQPACSTGAMGANGRRRVRRCDGEMRWRRSPRPRR